ncbi:hypothetical protein F4806DRAFT_501929, partial [Annulohypoxylon nitens]
GRYQGTQIIKVNCLNSFLVTSLKVPSFRIPTMRYFFSSTSLPKGATSTNIDRDDESNLISPTAADTLGLRVIAPAPIDANVDVDIVAVHGLGGDAFRTWTAGETIWLRDLLPGQLRNPPDEFKNGPNDTKVARVMTFGYDASVFTDSQNTNAFTIARDLLDDLKTMRLGSVSTRPLILIGHSLGGIVIKKALTFAQMRPALYSSLLHSIVHLYFFGTPHQGTDPSSMAGLLRSLAQALTRPNQGSIIQELQLWSSFVVQENARFAEIAEAFTITTFFETKKLHGVLVVNEGSATLNKTREAVVSLDRNHSTMCKFTDTDDVAYRRVFSRLHAVISMIGSREQLEEKERRLRCLASLPANSEIMSLDDKWFEMLDWVSSIRCGEHHDEAKYARTPNTCEWLLLDERFQQWENSDSQYAILWLQGSPGAGKTFLTSKVVDHIQDSLIKSCDEDAFAFFYCDRHEDERREPLSVLRSYVRQLLAGERYAQEMQEKFYSLYSEKRCSASHLTIVDCFQQLLKLMKLHTKTTLVLDGLDECEPRSRKELIRTFRILLSESKCTLRIFISSRPDKDIRDEFLSQPNIEIQANHNKEDIRMYVKEQITKSEKWNSISPTLKDDIIQVLLTRSQGMFLWVSLQIEQILELVSEKAIRDRLGKLPASLEDAYNELYGKIVCRHEYDRYLVDSAIMWVMCACRPLNRYELLCAIRLNPRNEPLELLGESLSESKLLHLCNNFLVLDSQLGVWRFAHLSVAEYFEKGHMNLLRSHAFVAKVCLKLQMEPSYLMTYDEIASDDTSFRALTQLRDYSLYHWVTHVQAQEGHDVDHQLAYLLKRFLGSFKQSSIHYRRWHDELNQVTNLEWEAPSTSIFSHRHNNYVRLSEISLGKTTIFAVCRFSIYSLLADWWVSTAIFFSQRIADYDNLMMLATVAGSKRILEFLVSRGISINIWNNKYGGPLALAIRQNDLELVKFLVEKGADMNTGFGTNFCALEKAIDKGNVKIVELLAQAGADVNMRLFCTKHKSALATAVHNLHSMHNRDNERVNIVEFLVQQGARMNPCHIALIEAMPKGVDDVVKLFISEACEHMMTTYDYMKVLEEAISLGKIEIIKLLLQKRRVDVDTVYDGGTALMRAIYHGNTELAKFLVKECNADVNIPLNYHGHGNALSMAAYRRKTAIVNSLVLEGRADVNATLQYGFYGNALTAAAVCFRNARMIIFLVQKGKVDVNVRLKRGRYGSALAAAAYWGLKDNVDALLHCGANVNLILSIGSYSTALQAARADISDKDIDEAWWDNRDGRERKQGKAEVVELLIRHGAIEY